MWRGWWLKARALLARRTVERELDDEVRLHLEMETEANIREGMSPDEARRKAYVAFGGVERFKEKARTVRGTGWFEDALRDVRYALRGLARSPGFAAATVLTLGLGVGAVTSVYSVVRGVVLRPLPYAEPDRLVTVWLENAAQGIEEDITSWPNFVDWRERGRSFSHMVAVDGLRTTLTGQGDPEEVLGARVSRGFFEMLGRPLVLGRGFHDDEVEGGPVRVVVLSHALWTRRYGADPEIVGRTVRLDDVAREVVGVAGPGRGYPRGAELWTPLTFPPGQEIFREARGALWLPVVGRLADGATLEGARLEMDGVARELAAAWPEVNEGMGIGLEPLRETLVGDVRTPLMTLLASVILVLLIAVVNVANLLLARGTTRAREMAVRLSLGARRGRLVRQVLVESLVSGGLGSLLGGALAWSGVGLLLSASPPDLPRLDEVAVDVPVLLFALAVAVGASLLFGLLPAVQLGRVEPGAQLREGTRGSSDAGLARVRSLFVSGQFALALVLLVGAGLLLRSFLQLRSVDPGFEPEGVLSARVGLPAERYPDDDAVRSFHDALLSELEALPGVRRAALASTFFLTRLPNMGGISLEGRFDPGATAREDPVVRDAVSPGFFAVTGMELTEGRTLRETDRADGPRVAVVNRAFVRRFLPGRPAVGERFVFGGADAEDTPWITVVGVVGDARRSGLDREVRPDAYLPAAQVAPRRVDVLLRTRGEPLAAAPALRRVLRDLDPLLPLTGVRTLEQGVAESLSQRRFVMFLLVVFAVAATLLAAVGIYGVMAYVVARRTREIGIRVALGAHRGAVIGRIMKEAMTAAGAGLAVGAGAALLLTRFVRSQLYGLEPTDPATFAGVAVLLASVAALGSLVPAWRASRVDPVGALRTE